MRRWFLPVFVAAELATVTALVAARGGDGLRQGLVAPTGPPAGAASVGAQYAELARRRAFYLEEAQQAEAEMDRISTATGAPVTGAPVLTAAPVLPNFVAQAPGATPAPAVAPVTPAPAVAPPAPAAGAAAPVPGAGGAAPQGLPPLTATAAGPPAGGAVAPPATAPVSPAAPAAAAPTIPGAQPQSPLPARVGQPTGQAPAAPNQEGKPNLNPQANQANPFQPSYNAAPGAPPDVPPNQAPGDKATFDPLKTPGSGPIEPSDAAKAAARAAYDAFKANNGTDEGAQEAFDSVIKRFPTVEKVKDLLKLTPPPIEKTPKNRKRGPGYTKRMWAGPRSLKIYGINKAYLKKERRRVMRVLKWVNEYVVNQRKHVLNNITKELNALRPSLFNNIERELGGMIANQTEGYLDPAAERGWITASNAARQALLDQAKYYESQLPHPDGGLHGKTLQESAAGLFDAWAAQYKQQMIATAKRASADVVGAKITHNAVQYAKSQIDRLLGERAQDIVNDIYMKQTSKVRMRWEKVAKFLTKQIMKRKKSYWALATRRMCDKVAWRIKTKAVRRLWRELRAVAAGYASQGANKLAKDASRDTYITELVRQTARIFGDVVKDWMGANGVQMSPEQVQAAMNRMGQSVRSIKDVSAVGQR